MRMPTPAVLVFGSFFNLRLPRHHNDAREVLGFHCIFSWELGFVTVEQRKLVTLNGCNVVRINQIAAVYRNQKILRVFCDFGDTGLGNNLFSLQTKIASLPNAVT